MRSIPLYSHVQIYVQSCGKPVKLQNPNCDMRQNQASATPNMLGNLNCTPQPLNIYGTLPSSLSEKSVDSGSAIIEEKKTNWMKSNKTICRFQTYITTNPCTHTWHSPKAGVIEELLWALERHRLSARMEVKELAFGRVEGWFLGRVHFTFC